MSDQEGSAVGNVCDEEGDDGMDSGGLALCSRRRRSLLAEALPRWNRPKRETMMKAFVIAAETPEDESIFSEYRKAIPATLEAFGGKFVARGGNLNCWKGNGCTRVSS
jgi:hypothetical protein